MVETKNASRGLADWIESLNHGSRNSEVLHPGVAARIVESNKSSCARDDAADIATFLAVAHRARKRKVFQLGVAAMFAADDVIYLESEERIVLVDETVLANEVRPARDLAAQILANQAAHALDAAARALWPIA